MRTYERHKVDPVGEQIKSLIPEGSKAQELTPNTPVVVRHRGRHILRDKFDGRDYVIEPGLVEMPYGAAAHFQSRAVIPGTRNPEEGTQQSYLGILGIDPDEICQPLTDEEVELYGAAIEAIDRTSLSDPADRDVKAIVGAQPRKGRGGMGGRKPQIDNTGQASKAAEEAAEHAFEKPETTDAARDGAESVKAGRGRGRKGDD